MHYLEDDLELLEGVPEELRQQCFEMRDLDGRVEKSLSDVREESREFFNIINKLDPEERERRCAEIKKTYKSIREMSEEKLAIAEYLHLMLEKYQERIAKDLTEFKYELEADTAGVTDGIEKELGESIKSASASRKSARPGLGSLVEVAEHDSGFEDIKPPSGLSSTQNSSAGVHRMNGHRHPASLSEAVGQPDERRLGTGEEFLASSSLQQISSSAGRPLAVRRPVAAGSSRGSLDETSSTPDFLPPKKKVPRQSVASPMAFSQSQQQVLDNFGIRKTSHPSQRYSPAPIAASPAGSASVNASRQPLRFNYPNNSALSGAVIGSGGRSGVHSSRPLIGQLQSELATKISGSGSSTSSENTYQQHHPVQPAQSPSFVGQAESQSSYGRPVKLTSRVQQMLKDRQVQGHRVGRPSSSLYSASSSSSSYNSSIGNSGQSGARFSSSQHNNVGELSEEEGRQLYTQDQQYLDEEADEEDAGALPEEDEEADEDSEDQDSRVWCTCQQKSEGDMVACDNKNCPYEWFHYPCVGITAPPKGKWFCSTCVKKMRRSQSTENH